MAPKVSPGVFPLGYVFQRGDLPFFVKDASGSPFSPYKVTYTLFRVAGESTYQVGPCDRTPVQADVGEYYVSSVAGECGKVGCWLVKWTYQAVFGGPCSTDSMGFRVLSSQAFASCASEVTSSNTAWGCNPRPACQWRCHSGCGCGQRGW